MASASASLRYSRSLRQWPSLDTMISTRGRMARSCRSQSMPNSSAMGPNPARRAGMSAGAAPSVSTWTRMKKRFMVRSANCWLSRMLLPDPCR